MTSKPELAEVAPEGWPVLAAAGVITILLAFIALPCWSDGLAASYPACPCAQTSCKC